MQRRVQNPKYFEMNGCRNCKYGARIHQEAEMDVSYYCLSDGTGPPDGTVDIWDDIWLRWSDTHKVHSWGCCQEWSLAQ